MDDATLRRLEFPRILSRLADLCSFGPSRELALALSPAADRHVVARRLQEVDEARRFLAVHPGAGRGLRDIRDSVRRARKGGLLTGQELVDVADFVEAAAALARSVREAEDCPALREIAAPVRALPDLVQAVRAAIRDDGLVRDDASPELAALRARARMLEQRVRERLEAVMRSLARQGVLQEALVTLRGGRFVLPVRAEHRGRVRGIVHDQSGSGATLFIEPAVVVDLNNQLRECQLAADREEERILGELSRRVGEAAPDLEAAVAACAYLDFTLARARLAGELDASPPVLVEAPRLRLERARHPLLGRDAVPIDVEIGRDFDVLIITGPNTGGKTVALKTIGLTAVMAQSGLHVPCDRAEVGVFTRIFADIGDEQSIEQSLSTFSSHLTNIMTVVPVADAHTLVLLDELGAGTDPEEGAALAMALLDHFLARGARTVATTHFGQLKAYAYRHPRVRNASVEFDVETLRPTYRLRVGTPGRSNALEIALRLGMPAELVARARSYLSAGTVRVEEAIAGLDATRRQLEAERAALGRERDQLARRLAELERREALLEERRRRFSDEVRAEVRARVNRLIQEAEEAVAELRRMARERAAREADAYRTLERLRQISRGAEEELRSALGDDDGDQRGPAGDTTPVDGRGPFPGQQEGQGGESGGAPADLAPGAEVWIGRLGRAGRIVAGPDDDGTVLVEAGRLRIRVDARDLRPVPPAVPGSSPGGETGPGTGAGTQPPAPRAATSGVALRKAGAVPPEISLRGLRVDEALARLDKYLDDAFLAGLTQVRVIHGKGTGTLRRAVHEMLREDPRVEGFELAGPREGSHGVTVVRLKG